MPALKPEDKWKLTAHEGSRTRKVATCTFRSRSDEQYNEMDIACITNLGQLSVYTIKGLRRQMNIDAINKTDIKYVFSYVLYASVSPTECLVIVFVFLLVTALCVVLTAA